MRLMLSALLCLAPAFAYGQAFGIQPAQPIPELNIVGETDQPYRLRIEPPEPNRNFSDYFVVASAAIGVCAVFGETGPLTVERTISLKADLIKALTPLYGEPMFSENLVVFSDMPADLTMVGLSNKGNQLQLVYMFRDATDCMVETPELDTTGL